LVGTARARSGSTTRLPLRPMKEGGAMSHRRARDVVACLTLLGLRICLCRQARGRSVRRCRCQPGRRRTARGVKEPANGRSCGWLFLGRRRRFKHVRGVMSVTSGYSGGSASTAQYEAVSTGLTGHAESVRIAYDPAQISYGQLLNSIFLGRAQPHTTKPAGNLTKAPVSVGRLCRKTKSNGAHRAGLHRSTQTRPKHSSGQS